VRPATGEEFRRAQSNLFETRQSGRAHRLLAGTLFARSNFCQTEDHENFALAERVPGKSTRRSEMWRENRHGHYCVAVRETQRRGLSQHCGIIDGEWKTARQYSQDAVPDDPLITKIFIFGPRLGFQACRTTHGSIGVCVCWDQWFPEAGAVTTALRGAEIIFYPTAIGGHPSGKEKIRPSTAFGHGNHPA